MAFKLTHCWIVLIAFFCSSKQIQVTCTNFSCNCWLKVARERVASHIDSTNEAWFSAWQARLFGFPRRKHQRITFVRRVRAQKYRTSSSALGSLRIALEMDHAAWDDCQASSHSFACFFTLSSGWWYNALTACTTLSAIPTLHHRNSLISPLPPNNSKLSQRSKLPLSNCIWSFTRPAQIRKHSNVCIEC